MQNTFQKKATEIGFKLISYGGFDESVNYLMVKKYEGSDYAIPISRYRILAMYSIGTFVYYLMHPDECDGFGLLYGIPVDNGYVVKYIPKNIFPEFAQDLFKFLGDEYTLDELDPVLDEILTPDLIFA